MQQAADAALAQAQAAASQKLAEREQELAKQMHVKEVLLDQEHKKVQGLVVILVCCDASLQANEACLSSCLCAYDVCIQACTLRVC